jgi:hypothetical protein
MQASGHIGTSCKCGATPLVVDLDGTLIRSDLLVESAFACVGADPLRIGGLLVTLLKAEIASETAVEATDLPYDDRVLTLVREAHGAGRPVHLASASNERYVRAVAEHLGLFDGWFASSNTAG